MPASVSSKAPKRQSIPHGYNTRSSDHSYQRSDGSPEEQEQKPKDSRQTESTRPESRKPKASPTLSPEEPSQQSLDDSATLSPKYSLASALEHTVGNKRSRSSISPANIRPRKRLCFGVGQFCRERSRTISPALDSEDDEEEGDDTEEEQLTPEEQERQERNRRILEDAQRTGRRITMMQSHIPYGQISYVRKP